MFMVPYKQFMRKVHALVIGEDDCGFHADQLKHSNRAGELDKLRRIHESHTVTDQGVK